MASPPAYSDLGKPAKDLLSKGYHYGAVKVELKTKTSTNLQLTTGGSSHLATGKINGGLELKLPVDYIVPFTLKEKWTTDNVFHTEISIEDEIAEGAKLACETAYAPASGKKTGKVKAAYRNHILNSNLDVDFNFAGPTVHGAAVLGYGGFFLGYQTAYDTASSKWTKKDFALGFAAPDFHFCSAWTGGADFSGSIYHKVNESLEMGVGFSWARDSPASPTFAIGSKVVLDEDSTIAAKINHASAIGLSYSQRIRSGVKLIFSCLVDAKNFSAGGHQVGLGLDFAQS